MFFPINPIVKIQIWIYFKFTLYSFSRFRIPRNYFYFCLFIGKKVNSFSLVELLSGLAIRYVQSDHKNKEPNSDVFIFHVTDGINQSPNYNFLLQIEVQNHFVFVKIIFNPDSYFNKNSYFLNKKSLLMMSHPKLYFKIC